MSVTGEAEAGSAGSNPPRNSRLETHCNSCATVVLRSNLSTIPETGFNPAAFRAGFLLADWRAGRDAVYQLAAPDGRRPPRRRRRISARLKRKPRRGDRGFRRSAIKQGECVDRLIPGKQRRDAIVHIPVCNIHRLSDQAVQPDARPEPGLRLEKHGGLRLSLPRVARCYGRPLGGKAPSLEWLVRRYFTDIRSRPSSFFVDLGEQPGLNCSVRPLPLRIIIGETAGLKDYGAQFGDAAATTVVEVDQRKPGAGHRILQEHDHRCCRQTMLAAQMEKSADKAMAAVSVIVAPARPAPALGKKLEHEIEQLRRFGDFR